MFISPTISGTFPNKCSFFFVTSGFSNILVLSKVRLYHQLVVFEYLGDPIWLAQAPKKDPAKKNPEAITLKKCHEKGCILTKLPQFYYLFGFFWFQLRWFFPGVFFVGSSLGYLHWFLAFFHQGAFRELSHTDSGGGNSPVGSLVVTLRDDLSCLQVFVKPALSEAFFLLSKKN